jgi:hypothetical protein
LALIQQYEKHPLWDTLKTETIFVAISSYRDSELCITLQDIWNKALHPERVFFGIVEQNDIEDAYTAHAKNSGIPKDHIRIKTMHFKEAKGPTWARHLCEKLWNGEEFYLLTDRKGGIIIIV